VRKVKSASAAAASESEDKMCRAEVTEAGVRSCKGKSEKRG
jgi:hypothetical protein